MIKANELRIGNKCLNKSGAIDTIIGIETNDEGYAIVCLDNAGNGETEINPIPLTPEILDKCVFDTDNITHWREYSTDGCISYLSLTHSIYHWLYTNQLSEIDDYPNTKALFKLPCEFVHQFQNIYFIFSGGEELEINL